MGSPTISFSFILLTLDLLLFTVFQYFHDNQIGSRQRNDAGKAPYPAAVVPLFCRCKTADNYQQRGSDIAGDNPSRFPPASAFEFLFGFIASTVSGFMIPFVGFLPVALGADSLNVAAAASVAFWQLR